MDNLWYWTGLATGVFTGNFLFHAIAGNYFKGFVVGWIAAELTLVFGIIFAIVQHYAERRYGA